MHKPQQHADRQHPSRPAVSSGKPAHVSPDFPFANARGVCIKCGDRLLIGSWKRRPEYDLLPMNNGSRLDKKFDELAGKWVCDSCHKKYPLAQHMFQMWKPEVTGGSAKLVSQRAAYDLVDPAKAAATMFALSHSSGNSGSSSSSNSSVSSDSSASDLQNDTETVIATVLDGIFDAACSSVINMLSRLMSYTMYSNMSCMQYTHRLLLKIGRHGKFGMNMRVQSSPQSSATCSPRSTSEPDFIN